MDSYRRKKKKKKNFFLMNKHFLYKNVLVKYFLCYTATKTEMSLFLKEIKDE